jgi:enoyl-CoA hydratase/carnithine racemase
VSQEVLLIERVDTTAVLTLNRPESRNALNSALLRAIPEAMAACEADDDVSVVVLTGADPAFCAGLDLRELGSSGDNLTGVGNPGFGHRFWAPMAKPVIGAVNGAAVTGGFEVALQCDFLVASERARFGDTHARVGVLPGGGLSVLLPQAIGVRRAKEMSLTGNFMAADEALQWGLVNHVVPHDELLPLALHLAADIASYPPEAPRALLAEYNETTATTVAEGLEIEAKNFVAFQRSFDPAQVEARRAGIVDRGRAQG